MFGPNIYGYASPGIEAGFDEAPPGGEGGDEVVKKEVGEVFVEDTFVSIGPKIQLKGLGLHYFLVGDI